MITCSSTPISPLRKRSCRDLKLGSKRRLNPTSILTPAAATTRRHASTRRSDRSIGFSQKIALPALAAATARSAWVSVDEAITTAPIFGSLMAVSRSTTVAPYLSASFLAAFGFTSTT